MTKHGPVSPEDIRALPTSEIALLLLKSLASQGGKPKIGGSLSWAQEAYESTGEPDAQRLVDAWAWLEAHALVGPDPGQTSGSGWERVTTRGYELAEDPRAITTVIAEERLAMSLHPSLESKVRPIFLLGDHETAAFSALKEVEVRVRDLSSLSDLLGVPLMRKAFKKAGPLADGSADGGEQVATMDLFAGAIGTPPGLSALVAPGDAAGWRLAGWWPPGPHHP
jgi:hypothetical protein